MAKSKVVTPEEAMKHCFDGMTILLPGFVNCGVPATLIKSLVAAGIKDLNVISNNTSETCEKAVNGEIDITFVPQGSLCEKVRAGGAGIGGILTPTGVHTPMQDGKQLLEWDNEEGKYIFVDPDEPQKGARFILELPLHADVCFVHAYKADKIGNVVYHRTARNFNQIFATAADFVIVEAENIVEVGELDPDEIMTPGALVDMVVQAEKEVE